MRRLRVFAALLLTSACGAYGQIRGRVIDQTRAGLGGAFVRLTPDDGLRTHETRRLVAHLHDL